MPLNLSFTESNRHCIPNTISLFISPLIDHSGSDRSNQHSDNDHHGHHDHFGDHAEAHHGPHHDRLDLIMQTLVRFSRKSLANQMHVVDM